MNADAVLISTREIAGRGSVRELARLDRDTDTQKGQRSCQSIILGRAQSKDATTQTAALTIAMAVGELKPAKGFDSSLISSL